jgi:amino acid adenylation domain-containing protein
MRRPAESSIPRLAPGVLVPLSPAQQHVWFSARVNPDSPEDSVFEVRAFEHMPSRQRLTDAVRIIIGRHDAFRVRVVEVDGQPMQQDGGQVEPPVEWVDLSGLAPDAADAEAARIAASAAATPFRVDEAPLFRVIGIELPGGSGRLVLGFHHLVFDHWSMSDVIAELGALISGTELEAPSDVSFLDYVSWECRQVDRLAEHRGLAYWRKKLAGELPILTLPADRPRPVAPTRRGDQFDVEFGSRLAAALREFTKRESTTPFIVLLTAYKALLMRLSGSSDVVVGSPFAGRDDVIAERIVGSFLRPVALRTDLSGEPTFREAMHRVEDTVLEAMDHQAVPFHRIVADLNLPRRPGLSPVFQTVFGVQSPAELRIGSADIGGAYLPTRSSKADLSLLMTVTSDSFVCTVEYSTDLFDEATVRRLCGLYAHLLECAIEKPDDPLSVLPLIDAAETDRIVHGLHPYLRRETGYLTVAEPFEEWAVRTPDATALVAGEQTVTYRELNERANQLAHHLIDRGLAPGDKVALFIERGIPMVVAVLAAAKAGCPYVPLDTDLPPDRLRFMLADSHPALVVSDAASAPRLPAEAPASIVIDGEPSGWSACPSHNPAVAAHPAEALYLLYTSGTTGRPNAVSYPANGVLANILWLQSRYPFAPGEASLFKTSYGFDVSAWEIFWPLAFGARVVIARPGGQREPEYLRDLAARHGVTMVFFVPSLLPAFIDAVRAGECPALRWVFCGGEPISPRLRDAFYDNVAASLVNCCGPTEAGSVVDMALPRDPGSPRVPLGEPASNFRVYVLDKHLQVLPVGVPGEMYVGGEVGLAHGYHGKPALTAERFVPDPFGPSGGRMYRTGDLCRHTEQNLLEHLGRIGRQVKIRGLRVELAEVEAVLEAHRHISQAAVVLLHGGSKLGACIVPAPGASVPLSEVQSYLRAKLPPHMIPAQVVELDALPVNVNGKVDARAIEALIAKQGAGGGQAPENATEAKLAGVFCEVLDLPSVGVTDSFFELGGHSILVFRLAARCAEVFGVKPSVNSIFGAPSVRELAAVISRESAPDKLLVHLAGERGKPVLIFVHAASGSVLPFQAVADHLADSFDVYGLQTPPGDCEPLSVVQLAERHAAAVAAAGVSPAALLGWSMGGCVALELARLWDSKGRRPAVVLLDTWCPPELTDPDIRDAVHTALRAVDLGVPPGELAMLAAADLRDLQGTFDRNRDAFVRYRPEPFDFPAVLLAATDPYPSPHVTFPPGYLDGDRGFSRLLPAVTAREIAGNHLSVLAAEHARTLAATIRTFVGARTALTPPSDASRRSLVRDS